MDAAKLVPMEAIRLIILVVFVASFATADNMIRVSGSGDYIICNPKPDDVVLYQGTVEKSSHMLRKVETDLNISTGTSIIHCIQVIDKKVDGNAAAVSVSEGGVGFNHATLKFHSQRGHGIHFNVTISGK